jgi:hypothetical protein
MNVTSLGEWEKWILYVLDAVEQTARNTGELIDRIIAAREACKYHFWAERTYISIKQCLIL